MRGLEFYRICSKESASYKILKSPDPGVEIKAIQVDGASLLTGVGVTVVDADVATCLAYEFIKDNREAIADRKRKRIVEADVRNLSDHSHFYLSVRDLGVRGLFNREFRVEGVWQVFDDGTAFLAYEDTNDLDDEYPANRFGTVPASIRTAYKFEPLPAVCGIPQTKVKFAARVDVKGIIPRSFTNRFVKKHVSNLAKLRLKFERDQEIDKESLAAISERIKAKEGYNGSDLSAQFAEMKGKSTIIQSKLGKCSGKITLLVRASLEDAAAYLFDYRSRANRAFGDFKRTAVSQKEKGDFELLVSRSIMFEGIYWNSQQECKFSSTVKLHRVDANTIVILTDPANRRSGRRKRSITFFGMSSLGKTGGLERTTVRLVRISTMETRVDVMTELDFCTPVGRLILKNEVKRELGGYKAMSRYFLNLLSDESLHLINKKDGISLGELLYEEGRGSVGVKGTVNNCAVKDAINSCAVLNSLQAEFPWFNVMIEEVIKNNLRPPASAIATKAVCLSTAEATKIGGSLAMSLATNITAVGGVDE